MTPTVRLLWIAGILMPLAVLSPFWPPLRAAVMLANLAVLTAAVIDRLRSASPRSIAVFRDVPSTCSVATENLVRIGIHNANDRPVTVEILDIAPEPCEANGLPLRGVLPAHAHLQGSYRYKPLQRGRYVFPGIHLRVLSPWGLWHVLERRDHPAEIRVLPDIRAVSRYELLARKNRLSEVGVQTHRLKGHGREFERLREYRRGDTMRQIDWKATARYQRLISREFTVERNQNVIPVVDCGRSMRNESDAVSYLDRAINAAVMLSYIALGQGDNVGFVAFASGVERSLKPLRGRPAIRRLLHAAYDLQAGHEAADYGEVIRYIDRHFRKRSLVVLITHAVDEQHLNALIEPLRLAAARSPHLFLVTLLTDEALDRLVTRPPRSDVHLFESAAAATLLTAQARATLQLKERGIRLVETTPDRLSAALINRYVALKAQQLL